MPNAYGDLTTLKSAAFLNAPDDRHDGRLLGLLEATSRWIDGYCDRQFAAIHGERRFDGTGKVSLAVPDLIAVSQLRVREASSGEWAAWPSDRWLLYPLNAIPTEPGGRPYTRIMATHDGRRFPLSRGGVSISGAWGYGDVLEDVGLSLASEAAAADDSVAVAVGDASIPSAGHTIRIGDEQMYLTGAANDGQDTLTLAVQRGVNGTAAATHAVGAGISVYRYPKGVTEACLLQAAVWWRERLAGPFRPDTILDRSAGDGRGDVGGISPTVRALLEPYRRRVAALGV